MALQKNTTMPTGVTVSNAYHRVNTVRIDQKNLLRFTVSGHVNPDLPEFEVQAYSCAYDIAGENPIEQAYEHLKTLSEFAGATDV